MGQFFETIPEYLMKWILEQKMFWVATSPLSASGHVNVSPKGGLYFGLLDDKTFWYMDLSGSGSETIAHLYEPDNGRITVMFNSFEGPPRIVRLFGHGSVLERGGVHEGGGEAFDDFVKKHDLQVLPSSRSIIIVKVHQVASSCGYSVPYYEFKDFRNTLNETFTKKAEKFEQGKSQESRERYWAFKNAYSVDGLPGMKIGYKTGKQEGIAPIQKMVGPMAPRTYHNSRRFGPWHLVLVAVLSAVCGAFFQRLLLTTLQGILDSSAS
ncbi:hypothetical protein CHGG_03730 [Chaetomium globosum CBS 148.51]|uniref:Uncharacterized protein n=1 Tax=Chaetomium globosum (strain ATCC 6205 / CBS 148.51 / DSM 1962 / NBRC 6347 / NRRL 1970) TaxID=306901 RepID=Q2H3B6_CHAGB|nr:uncharacterized protein CHGG_03730 [Chaetomium globosum CBS 148.51]EAQ87111.1 hypothetical protein CHGG_03730 [Chaetomium globosum CBS 148.51]